MNKGNYFNLARTLSAEAFNGNRVHTYFEQHRDRLWSSFVHFGLQHLRNADILEIGPFYSYTPFLLQQAGNRLSILEGDDADAYPLKPLYETHKIPVQFFDLFERFGESHSATYRLPYNDQQFDAVICWETMEHFNFNPVPFVKEIWRVLRQGGRAYVTVPNAAKLDKRIALLRGNSSAPSVNLYCEQAGRKCYSYHWREYTQDELTTVFSRNGFTIEKAGHLHTFQNRDASTARGLKRALLRPLVTIFPGFGNLCTVVAIK